LTLAQLYAVTSEDHSPRLHLADTAPISLVHQTNAPDSPGRGWGPAGGARELHHEAGSKPVGQGWNEADPKSIPTGELARR
jgi:hypothetical protein